MVYRINMKSREMKGFVRDFELLSSQTFFEFHKAIQNNLHYDNSQIASFFLTNKEWKKEMEFTLFDMTDSVKIPAVPMDKAVIGDYLKDLHQRCLYVFDFFNERAFLLELKEIYDAAESGNYPRVVFSEGSPPAQTLFDLNFPLTADFDEE